MANIADTTKVATNLVDKYSKVTGSNVDGATSKLKTASAIMNATSKSSIMRLTKDLIFQFPLVISSSIDSDELFPMIKSFEKNYAQIVFTAIMADSEVNRDKYENLVDFLKKFHNNDDLPFGANEATDTFDIKDAIATEGFIAEKDLCDMWDCVSEQINSETLNSLYLPYTKSAFKIATAIDNARAATEADTNEPRYEKRAKYQKDNEGKIIKDNQGKPIVEADKNGNPIYEYVEAKVGDKDAKTMTEWDIETAKLSSRNRARNDGEIIRDDKFNAFTPTLIKVTLVNTRANSGSPWEQTVVLGVRAMPHIIKSELMINNMMEAFKNRAIFLFIKWTRGEIKLADILFNVKGAKEEVTANSSNKWLKVLRRRKGASNLRFMGQKFNPNCTIIITDFEAERIKSECGIDPYDVKAAATLIDKYFLLGFGIYDTEGKMLHMMYDSDTGFSSTSLRAMIADSKKDVNLLSMNRY